MIVALWHWEKGWGRWTMGFGKGGCLSVDCGGRGRNEGGGGQEGGREEAGRKEGRQRAGVGDAGKQGAGRCLAKSLGGSSSRGAVGTTTTAYVRT